MGFAFTINDTIKPLVEMQNASEGRKIKSINFN